MTTLDEEQPTLPLDEETIANELGSRVVTSLGPPPECTYNARSLRVSVQGKRLSEAAPIHLLVCSADDSWGRPNGRLAPCPK